MLLVKGDLRRRRLTFSDHYFTCILSFDPIESLQPKNKTKKKILKRVRLRAEVTSGQGHRALK